MIRPPRAGARKAEHSTGPCWPPPTPSGDHDGVGILTLITAARIDHGLDPASPPPAAPVPACPVSRRCAARSTRSPSGAVQPASDRRSPDRPSVVGIQSSVVVPGRDIVLLALQLQGDVDDHVLLPADVASLADPLQDGVCGNLVALSGPFGVQQEAGVDPSVPSTIAERSMNGSRGIIGRPTHRRHAARRVRRRRWPPRVARRWRTAPRRRVPGPGAERAERTVDLQRSVLLGQHRVRHAEREVLVSVEPHLSFGADLSDQCRDAGLRIT